MALVGFGGGGSKRIFNTERTNLGLLPSRTAMQGSNKALGRAFATAIQYHPRDERMWIKAAKWEFEENANSEAARILLQRALRLNKTSESLWREVRQGFAK